MNLFKIVAEFEHINLRAGPINTPNATKASVIISFQLFGTLMCFICSHFSGMLTSSKTIDFIFQILIIKNLYFSQLVKEILKIELKIIKQQ